MNIRLVIGYGEVSIEFDEESERNTWWKNMINSPEWSNWLAKKAGKRTIVFNKGMPFWSFPLTLTERGTK